MTDHHTHPDWLEPTLDTDTATSERWERLDDEERREQDAHDRVTRDVGERRTCPECGGWYVNPGGHAERCTGRRP